MSQLHPLLEKSAFQRLEDTLSTIKKQQELYILKDDHGCVMLTTEDEDGVPIWPDAELAQLWANEDWEHCEPMALSVSDFLKKWVPGMSQDDLMVIVCPIPAQDGEVISPQEFAQKL